MQVGGTAVTLTAGEPVRVARIATGPGLITGPGLPGGRVGAGGRA